MSVFGKIERFDLEVRARDGKCRGVGYGQPITGWCSDALKVIEVIRRKMASTTANQGEG